MRRILFAILLLSISLFVLDSAALAKPKPAKQAPVAQASVPAEEPEAPAPDNSWKGVVGGAVLAIGAGDLAAKTGMEPATFGIVSVVSIVVLLVAGFVFIKVSAGARRGKAVYAGDYLHSIMPERKTRAEPAKKEPVRRALPKEKTRGTSRLELPSDFDANKFFRSVNSLFLRVQVAWDRGDLDDLREVTSADLFEAFKTQIRKRGDTECRTGVESLDPKLMKLEVQGGSYAASVRFRGVIREENTAPKPFVEVWSLTKPKKGADGWTVAEIQQFS